MEELVLPAPAKLNLFLHINGQKENGYHELQSILQFIDHCDTLTFTPRKDQQIYINGKIPNIYEKNNLILLAAKAMQQQYYKRRGMDINIVERIQNGSGLGANSSRAATGILALNHMWNLKLPLQQLLTLGLQISPSIPAFIYGKACWAENFGEKITPLELPKPWFVVIIPSVQVSTAEIFFDKKLTRKTPKVKTSLSLLETGENNCQEVTLRRYPEVWQALNWLGEFNTAQMSGTGAAIFARFTSYTEANKVLQQLPNSLKGFVAHGLNTSPLLTALKINR